MSTVNGTKQLTCPHCGHQDRYQIAPDTQTVWCPKCQAKITLTRKRREAEPARVPSPPPMPRKVVAQETVENSSPKESPEVAVGNYIRRFVSLSILAFGLSGIYFGNHVAQHGLLGDNTSINMSSPGSFIRHKARALYMPLGCYLGILTGLATHFYCRWNQKHSAIPIAVSVAIVVTALWLFVPYVKTPQKSGSPDLWSGSTTPKATTLQDIIDKKTRDK